MDIAKTFIKEETTFCHIIHENPYLQVKVQVFKNTYPYTFTHTHIPFLATNRRKSPIPTLYLPV